MSEIAAIEEKDRQFVEALARGVRLLKVFSSARAELTAAEVGRLAELPQASAWRLCKTLVALGWLTQIHGSDRLRAGLPTRGLGAALLADFSVLARLRPFMRELVETYEGAVSLAGRAGQEMIFLERLQGRAFVTDETVGSRVPIDSSPLGLAYLAGVAACDKDGAAAFARPLMNSAALGGVVRVQAALSEFRTQGYVVTRGLIHPDVNAAATPIWCAERGEVLALSCGGLARIFTDETMHEVGAAMADFVTQAGLSASSKTPPGTPQNNRHNQGSRGNS
jgi:DNA-binding IclR family transcriptional regulator